MSKVVVIVQARMTSTRLPGKVLMDLSGRSVLGHVLDRCAAIPGIDGVCCALPEGVVHDAAAVEAMRAGVSIFRGSETDVLDRYAQAARACGADVVMRVTSDCPLIDPWLCGDVLDFFQKTGADLAANDVTSTWPVGLGVEVFSNIWLQRAATEAVKAYDREHVSPFILEHAEAKIVSWGNKMADLGHLRWTLDTPQDFCFLREIFSRIPSGPSGWAYSVPLACIEAEPWLAEINQPRYNF